MTRHELLLRKSFLEESLSWSGALPREQKYLRIQELLSQLARVKEDLDATQ